VGFINGVAELGGKSLANIPSAAAHGAVDLWRRWSGGDTDAPDPAAVRAITVPLSENARNVGSSLGVSLDAAAAPYQNPVATKILNSDVSKNYIAPVVKDVAAIAPAAAITRNAVRGIGGLGGAEAPPSAQDVANTTAAQQSGGAAGAAPNVTAASPELQKAISAASQKTGGAVNPDVLKAHLEADEHGVDLTKGQATRDPVQFSAEQNSTDPRIVDRINKQNEQMTDALDNIRREASPTTVGNDYVENGRAAVDALKAYDEPIQADIKAKYKALADANGGSLPIDTSKVMEDIQPQLDKHFLNKVAAGEGSISEVLDALKSGQPMSMESFENARTGLAAVQRGGGRESVAAGIVRNALENMPLSEEGANLKGLADAARSAAKNRFQELEADPAYKAAVEDVAAGNKRGSPSPLADTFLDKYALSKAAPKSQVDLMMQKINAADPDAAGAVSSHALNAVRKAAVNANGNVLPNGYNGALQKLGPKLDSLVAPDVRDNLESLGRTITNAKVPPAGNYVNYAKSGVIMNAAKSAAGDAIDKVTLGVGSKAINKIAQDRAAKEALAKGAGLDQLKTQ